MRQEELAKSIDHTNLNPDATVRDIEQLCTEAVKYNFASVVVMPFYVNIASRLLRDSVVKVGSVAGFPFGATTIGAKVHETREVIDLGADEIDMVMNVSALRSGLYDEVYNDIRAVVEAARRGEVEGGRDIIVKVIIETGLLNDEQKVRAAKIVEQAGADFVKTNTGFTRGGATIEDVELIRSNVPFEMGIKASGGIRSADQAVALLNAGANRIGTSTGVQIMEQAYGEGRVPPAAGRLSEL
ncbi:MAG TPA: deoxyribose-phosphate aldolase [Anaerolineae bacterium]|jgi:deoxyribose-phosphate aldolase|nr:deoxyribose-phosphate aldolase [Anaerolineae bacterium]